jgi:hypothetical protein
MYMEVFVRLKHGLKMVGDPPPKDFKRSFKRMARLKRSRWDDVERWLWSYILFGAVVMLTGMPVDHNMLEITDREPFDPDTALNGDWRPGLTAQEIELKKAQARTLGARSFNSRRVDAKLREVEDPWVRFVPTPEQVTRLREEHRRRGLGETDGSMMPKNFHTRLPEEARRRLWIDNAIAGEVFTLGLCGAIDPRDYDDVGRILDVRDDVQDRAKKELDDMPDGEDAFSKFYQTFIDRWLLVNGFGEWKLR